MRLAARRSTRFFVLALASLFALSGARAGASAPSTSRLLVKFRLGTGEASATATLGRANARDLRTISALNVHVVSVASDRKAAALTSLRNQAAIAYAEPDALLAPQELLPDDPSFPQQFAIAGGAWGWYTTHTTRAWDITKGDPSVVVAVLDTGLKTQGLTDYDGEVVAGWNVLKNSSDTSSSAGNHGTYVAGVVGLSIDNGVGNAGYCPGCRVMPVQVGTDSGAYLSDLASGLTWAADHGAHVANMSWAGTTSSSTLASAVSYARSKGMVVTAAAGNSNCNCPTYPAATPGVIGVAGTSNTDAKQGDSNYGNWVKLAAPEGNMTSWPSLSGAPGYAPVGGTSLAAPVVASLAGLLFSANPSLTGVQVEQALEASAAPMTFVEYGRVDALAALNYIGLADPQPSTSPLNISSPRVLLETNGVYDTTPISGSPAAGQVLIRGQGSWTGAAPLSLTNVQWQRCDPTGANCVTIGTAATYTVQSADTGYALRVLIAVRNGLGSTTAPSPLTGTVGGVTSAAPPVNVALPTISGTAQVGQTVSASNGSWSGAPIGYAYAWQRCDMSGGNCASISGAASSTYVAQATDAGSTLRVAVTATNAGGSTTAVSYATAAVSTAPQPPVTPSDQTVTFSGSLNQKSTTRTFTVTVDAGAAHAALSFSKCSSLTLSVSTGATASGPSVLTLDSVLSAGTYAYTVSGARCSFTLTVRAPLA